MNRDSTKKNPVKCVNEHSVNRYFDESVLAVTCHSVKRLSVKRRSVNGRSVNSFSVNGRRSCGCDFRCPNDLSPHECVRE